MELPSQKPAADLLPDDWPSRLDTQVAPALGSASPPAPMQLDTSNLPLAEPAITTEPDRSLLGIIVPLIVVFGFLGLITSLWAIPRIENSLREEALAALAEQNIEGGTVSFSGRNATLSGIAPEMSATAFETVKALPGVRSVEFVDEEAGKPSGGEDQVDLRLTVENDILTIDGTVLNNGQRDQLQLAAIEEFGTARFNDMIDVIDVADQVRNQAADQQVEQLSRLLLALDLTTSAEIVAKGGDLRIDALVADRSSEAILSLATSELEAYESADVSIVAAEPVPADGETGEESANNTSDAPIIPPAQLLPAIESQFNAVTSFGPGSANLTEEGAVQLNGLAGLLSANPDVELQITGHTDDVGDPIANVALSQERADAILTFLTEAGIDKGRLVAIGQGAAQPVASNETDEGRSQNRRVEFRINA